MTTGIYLVEYDRNTEGQRQHKENKLLIRKNLTWACHTVCSQENGVRKRMWDELTVVIIFQIYLEKKIYSIAFQKNICLFMCRTYKSIKVTLYITVAVLSLTYTNV